MTDASLKLSVDGASQFKKDLKDITDQSKLLAAQTKAVTSGFNDGTSAEEKYEKTSAALNKQIENQKKYMETLAKAIEASKSSTGEATAETTKLETQYAKAQTALNKMGAELKDAEKELKDNADGAKSAEKENSKFHDSLKRVGELLAAKGIEKGLEALKNGLDAMKKAAVAAGKAAVKAFTDSAQWADDLQTLSVQTGISTDKLQEFEYMAELIDTDVDTITGSMAKLIKNMGNAQKGTGSAAEAFKNLGISVTDNNGQLRDSESVFNEVISHLGRVSNETQRDALAMQIFGRSAQELNPLIAAGGQRMSELAQEAHNVGYVLDAEAIGSLTTSKDSFDQLQLSADALKRQFAAELAPAVADVGQKLADMFTNNEELKESVSGILEELGELVAEILPQILPLVAELLPIVTELARKVLPPIVELIQTCMPDIIALARELLPVISRILQVFLPFITKLASNVLPFLLRIVSALLPIISAILTVLEPILDLVIQILSPLLDVIGDALEPILSLLAPLISLLGSVLAPILRELGPIIQVAFWPLKTIVIPLINGVVSALRTLIGWIQSAVSWFNSLFGASSRAGSIQKPSAKGGSTRSTGGLLRSVNVAADQAPALERNALLAPDAQPMMLKAAAPLARLNSTVPSTLTQTIRSGMAKIAAPIGGQVNNSNVTNYGGVTIEVNAAQGQDANEIANVVMYKIQNAVKRREAVYA